MVLQIYRLIDLQDFYLITKIIYPVYLINVLYICNIRFKWHQLIIMCNEVLICTIVFLRIKLCVEILFFLSSTFYSFINTLYKQPLNINFLNQLPEKLSLNLINMKKIYVLTIFLVIWNIGYSQIDNLKKDTVKTNPAQEKKTQDELVLLSSVSPATLGNTVPVIVPPSTHSAEIGRFGVVPVGLFTGTVQFSIPIFELKNDNLKLPVSLNYSSNGLVVDKLASWTGYDWNLNAGGVITRYRNGKTDIPGTRPYSDWNTLTTSQKLGMLHTLETGNQDLQPDFFVVSLPNYSFKFAFNNSGNPVTIPYTPVKIVTNTTGAYSYFHITTPDGIIYKFEDEDSTYPPSETSFNTAWHLTEILHPTGDKIVFTYNQYIIEQKIAIDRKVLVKTGTVDEDPAGACDCSEFKSDIKTMSNSISYLSQIEFIGVGKIVLQKSTGRTDAPAEYKLDKIIIKDIYDTQIKAFQLNYQFPSRTGTYSCLISTADDLNYRMFLTSINEQDAVNSNIRTYSFEYNNIDELPSRFSYSQDHWGYFNGKYNNDIISISEVPPGYQGIFSNHVGSTVDRSPNYLYSKKGMLKKVIFPTGGYTTFDYEANKNSSELEIGGCRILNTKAYPSSSDSPIIKKYNYVQSSTPAALYPTYYQSQSTFYSYYFNMSTYNGQCVYGILSTNSLNNVYTEGQTHYCYPIVEVLSGENAENGKEKHTFRFVFDSPGTPVNGGQIQPIPMSNTGWSSGNLEEILTSDFASTSKLKEKTNFVYTETRNKNEILCLATNNRLSPNYTPMDDNTKLAYYDVVPYTVYSNWFYAGSHEVINYESNGSITTTYNNLFGNASHCQITEKSVINSYGVEEKTKYYYPEDYSGQFTTLINKYIREIPIDVRKYNGTRLISGSQTNYNDYGQPTDLYNFESSATDIAFSASHPFTFTHKQTIVYDPTFKQPTKVNLDNDIYTHYIWAYNKQYPVAKIVTPLSTSILITVNDNSLSKSDVLTSIKNDVTYLKDLLSAYLNNSNYQVTIYTYKPLVGMTSQTDPTGISTFYQYDSFGRLEFVKDHDEKLLKRNVYHYSGM